MTPDWPQPWERIRGTDMTGNWLLSLEPEAVAHRDALIMLARHLRTATLVGNPAPVVARMGQRMHRPQHGDLAVAVEVLYGRRPLDDRVKGLGIYLGGRKEWAEKDAVWEAYTRSRDYDLDPERMTDTVFYLQYGPDPGDICRWHNSEAVAVLSETWPAPAGAAAKRTETGAVFTRDSLTAGLADSGIFLRGQAPDLVTDPDQLVTIRTLTGEIVEVRDVAAYVTKLTRTLRGLPDDQPADLRQGHPDHRPRRLGLDDRCHR